MKKTPEEIAAFNSRRAKWISRILAIGQTMPHYWPDTDIATGYSEPGYSEPESGIVVLSNWNAHGYNSDEKSDQTMPRLSALLEYFGASIEWSDEWYTCSCGKCVRTTADSHDWTPSYWMYEGEIECCECVENDPSGYIEHLEGNEESALTMGFIDLSDHDYHRVNQDYETGWHYGQNDSPEKIAESLRDIGIERFIFEINESSMFYVTWSVWIHRDEFRIWKSSQRIKRAA